MAERRRTRVKICGLTRPEDARVAAWHGADAVGLVFHPPSPRAVTLAQAREIVAALPPFVTTVGLFVDPLPDQVSAALSAVPLDRLQFHGDETPEFCARFGVPFIKAIRMHDEVDVGYEARRFAAAAAVLLDTHVPGTPGGSGQVFGWERIPPDLTRPLILAGGLSAENVADAVARVQPDAVDVSSGVESAPGIKDGARIAAFIKGVVDG